MPISFLIGRLLGVTLITSLFWQSPASALDCEFATYLHENAKMNCYVGNPDACALVTLYQPNADKCPNTGARDTTAAQDNTTAAEPLPAAKPKLPNPFVQEIQTLLKIAGFDPGPIDGVLGLGTCNAALRFASAKNANVSCGNLVALRDELMDNSSDAKEYLAGCELLDSLPNDAVLARWQTRTHSKIVELDSLLRDLKSIDASLRGDLSSLTGLAAAVSATLRTGVLVTKISLGKAALLSFVSGDKKTGTLLLGALTLLQTAEAVTKDLNSAIDQYIDGRLDEFRSKTLEELKNLGDAASSLEALLEGVNDMDSFLAEEAAAAAAIANLRERVDALSRETWATRTSLKNNQAYQSMLAALSDARAQCASQVRP